MKLFNSSLIRISKLTLVLSSDSRMIAASEFSKLIGSDSLVEISSIH